MPTPKKATKEQIELNKRKQMALRMAGYNVKVDGSWGRWQEEQYRKISTHDKEYPTDILGTLTYLKDKLTGDTTYYQEPSIVTGYSGEIRADNRSDAKRWLDQQLSNNNPLGYLYRTVLPAGVVATGLVYGGPAMGKVATTAARVAPQVARATGQAISQGPRRIAANLMTNGTPSAVVQTTSGTVQVPVAASIPQWLSPKALLGTAALGTGVTLTRNAPIPISRAVSIASEAPTGSILTSPEANTQNTSSSAGTPNNGNGNSEKPKKPQRDNRYKKTLQEAGEYWKNVGNKALKYTLRTAPWLGAVGYGAYRGVQIANPSQTPTAADSLLEEQSRQIMELGKLDRAKQNQITIDSLRRSLSNPVQSTGDTLRAGTASQTSQQPVEEVSIIKNNPFMQK